MSQQGYLVWYTEDVNTDLVRVMQKLPQAMGFERADVVYRTHRIISGPADEESSLMLGESILASEVHRLYVPGTSIKIDCEAAELGDRIERAIHKCVSKAVRGDFIPNRPFVRVGKHYLYDSAETERVFARPTVVVGCWGYSSPNNWKRMRQDVEACPGIVAERKLLERVVGPLQQAMYWYI